MNALILTGGVWPSDERVRMLTRDCDFVICCDGAAKDARRLDIIPNILIGDMDSISSEDHAYLMEKGVKERRLPAEKDETDTEAACRYAISHGASKAVLVGGLGARMDHSFGNIQCLWMLHMEGIEARMVSGCEVAYIVTTTYRLGRYNGCTFSLIPLLPQTEVFRMTGVKYPLVHTPLLFGSTLGISNVVADPGAQLTMQSGMALLIINIREG